MVIVKELTERDKAALLIIKEFFKVEKKGVAAYYKVEEDYIHIVEVSTDKDLEGYEGDSAEGVAFHFKGEIVGYNHSISLISLKTFAKWKFGLLELIDKGQGKYEEFIEVLRKDVQKYKGVGNARVK